MSGERIVRFEQDQQFSDTDMNNIGIFGRASLDNVVLDAIEPGKRFTGFNVVQSGAAQITVGSGRLYNAGKVYSRADAGGTVIDLIDTLPVTVRKIVAIVVWGQEIQSGLQPRSFLVDVDTEQTEARTTPTELRRFANIDRASGLEAVDPQPPPLDAGVVAVAHVVLDPTGIVEIRPITANRLTSVADLRNRTGALELFRERAGAAIETLRSDLAGVAERQFGMARRTEVFEIAADVARLKEEAGIPNDASSYGADNFLDLSQSDPDHPDWLARIEEGVRFPAAQQATAQLALLNQFDDRVKVTAGFMLPNYNEVARIVVDGPSNEVAISQYVFNTWVTVQKARSRERLRYGESFLMCTNALAWREGFIDPVSGLFRRGNETFEILDNIGHPSGNRALLYLRLRQVWRDTYEESYWDRVQIEESVQGAGIAQTFLNSQDGWMTSLRLRFSRVGPTGNVRVMIAETLNGAPRWDRVITKTTVNVEDLRVAPQWTNIPIGPVHLAAGRYAIIVITAGNHFIETVLDNKFAEGSLFISTDGAFSQGDLTRDFTMQLLFAEFRSPRVEVQMAPIQLENGIANIDFLLEAIRPAGTDFVHEVQVNGVWRSLDETNRGSLVGLPALLPYRIVFVGTTDNHAGVALGAASTITTWRPRTDYKHVSDVIDLPAPCDEVELRIVVEWWEAARHTLEIRLLTGAGYATVRTPAVVEERALPDMIGTTGRREFRAVFSGIMPSIESFKIRLAGTTDNALVTYHVARRTHIGFAA